MPPSRRSQRHYEDFLIVDVDSHHYEIGGVRRDRRVHHRSGAAARRRPPGPGAARPRGRQRLLSGAQRPHHPLPRPQARRRCRPTPHRDITLMRRWMDAMGTDIACLFPTPMLNLSLSPNVAVQTGLAFAYNSWLCERILAEEPRIKSMLYLPFHDPAGLHQDGRAVRRQAGRHRLHGDLDALPQRVRERLHQGSTRMLQERGLPLAFHSATGGEPGLRLFNRFFGVHALGFCWHNMLYLTNWLINGMPERFPRLKTIWIESGLAWIPFLMQRLDNEYMMRSSEVPLLKRKPSEYMREMYFSSQPMEMVDNRESLELTFKLMNAETQLLYASDFPHWDMDLPEHDLRSAVPERAGQAQHPRRQRAAPVQPGADLFAAEARAPGGEEAGHAARDACGRTRWISCLPARSRRRDAQCCLIFCIAAVGGDGYAQCRNSAFREVLEDDDHASLRRRGGRGLAAQSFSAQWPARAQVYPSAARQGRGAVRRRRRRRRGGAHRRTARSRRSSASR